MIVGVEDVIEGIVALGLRIAISAQSFDTSETISSNSYQILLAYSLLVETISDSIKVCW